MADGRYDGMSHEELYNQLHAGDPQKVHDSSVAWNTAYGTANSIAESFTRTLKQLGAGWHSPAGAEYVRRVSAIGTYARELATGYKETASGLEIMSTTLKAAQVKAESPEKYDDHDKLLSGAVDGIGKGAIAGPGGSLVMGVVGAFQGHDQDEKEKEAAHDRIVALIESVANAYIQTRNLQFQQPPEPPDFMPEGNVNRSAGTSFGPGAKNPSLLYRPHSMGNEQTSGIDRPDQVSTGPQLGTGGNDPGVTDGTVVPVGDGPDTGLAGAGGGLGAGTPGGVGGLNPLGTGGQTSLTAGGLGTGLPLGGGPGGTNRGVDPRSAAGTGRGAGGTRAASGARRPGSGPRGETAPGKAAMGRGSGVASARGGSGSNTPSGRPNSAMRPGRAAAAGARGSERHDDVEEYDTWLTEDQLVWGDDSAVPPGVLGGPPPTEQRDDEQRPQQ